MKLEGKLLAPPKTKSYVLIGTAFDYLLRFRLQRLNRKLLSEWSFFGEAHLRYHHLTGRITTKLLEGIVCRARRDLASWGHIDDYDDIVDSHTLEDLRKLNSIVPIRKFKAKKVCSIWPHFGDAGRLVGGAAADVIIDDTLIDIKTVKKLAFSRDTYNQLWGYYMLSRIGRIDAPGPKITIRKLGVYFARHAKLVTFEVNDILHAKARKKCVEWFKTKLSDLDKSRKTLTSRRRKGPSAD
jgi:hypothetical protein